MKKLISCVLVLLCALNLSVVAMAATDVIVPSVEAKDVPGIIGDIEVLDKDMKVIGKLAKDKLLVTAYADRSCSYSVLTAEQNKAIKDALEKLYTNIVSAANVGKLVPGLDAVAKTYNPNYNASAFYVKDLFDLTIVKGVSLLAAPTVSFLGSNAAADGFAGAALTESASFSADMMSAVKDAILNPNAKYIRITFDTQLASDTPSPTFVTYDDAAGSYTIVPADRVERNTDGSLRVTFEDVGQFMILNVSADRANPGTGDAQNLIVWAIAAVVSLALAVVLIIYRRRQH